VGISATAAVLWGGGQGAGGVRKAGEEGREAGEIEENYIKLRHILQSEKSTEVGANKNRAGTGIEGYGRREV